MMYAVIILSTVVLGLGAWCARLQIRVREEKEKRWDEISRAAGLENVIEDRTRDISYYHEITCKHTASIIRLTSEKIDLQDRLSALLCPRNDHIWKDGVCAKCGRVKDAD